MHTKNKLSFKNLLKVITRSEFENKKRRKEITKSYRLPSNCFFRAPLLPIKLLSLSKSEASCSRTSKSFSPCNFFKTREDIFIALPIICPATQSIQFNSIRFHNRLNLQKIMRSSRSNCTIWVKYFLFFDAN